MRCKFPQVLILILFFILLGGCASIQNQTIHRTPLDMVAERLPLLHVMINGKPAAFVIDTGAEVTHIKPQAARRLGLVIRPSQQKTSDAHLAIRRVLGVVNIESLTTSTIKLRGHQAWCMDLPLPDGVDGLLSRKVFDDQVFTIDYPNRTLLVGTSSPNPSSPNTVPIGVHAQSAIRVPVSVGDHNEWFMVDTGFAGKMILENNSLKQTRVRLLNEEFQSSGVSSTIKTSEYSVLTPIKIGSQTFSDVRALSFPGAKNMIGSGLLMDYRVTIDQQRRVMSLEKVPQNPGPTVRPTTKP